MLCAVGLNTYGHFDLVHVMTESLELGLWFPCFTFSSLIGIVIRWAVSLHPYSGKLRRLFERKN